jgi:hypothetical protein
LSGRYILQGVVILHEAIHEIHRKKKSGVILKFDKVGMCFLQQVLRMKVFSSKWCSWIEQTISKGCVGIKVNNDIGHNFQTKNGVREGDPLLPILFNLFFDMLAILINRGKNLYRFRGVIPHLVDDGLSIRHYVDDTIIFL